MRTGFAPETIITFLSVLLALGCMFEAWSIDFKNPKAPGFFPMIVGFVLLLLSGYTLVKRFTRGLKANRESWGEVAAAKVLLIMALWLVWAAVAGYIGFLVSTILVMAISFWIHGSRQWLLNLILAVVLSVACLYAFKNLLLVPLP